MLVELGVVNDPERVGFYSGFIVRAFYELWRSLPLTWLVSLANESYVGIHFRRHEFSCEYVPEPFSIMSCRLNSRLSRCSHAQ
jgi:hypothetical protein